MVEFNTGNLNIVDARRCVCNTLTKYTHLRRNFKANKRDREMDRNAHRPVRSRNSIKTLKFPALLSNNFLLALTL